MATAHRPGRPAAQTLEQFDASLADLLVDQSQRTITRGSDKTLLWRCAEHLEDPHHVYPAKPYNKTSATKPTACPICAGKLVVPGINDVATTHPQIAALMTDQEAAAQFTAQSNKVQSFHCGDPTHQPWSAPLSRLIRQGSRCPQCSGRNAIRGINDLKTTHPELAAQLAEPVPATSVKAGSSQMLYWHCGNRNHDLWQATPAARVRKDPGCPQCLRDAKTTIIDPQIRNITRSSSNQ